jgi:hypothetical protein
MLRHSKLTSTAQWRAQPACAAQVLGGLLAAAGLVAARPAAAIDVFDDRKARDNGFDIIYEARDLDLPQSTRDGMTQARPTPVPTLPQHKRARARIRSLEVRWTCTQSTGYASCFSWCPCEGVAFGEQLANAYQKGHVLQCASVRARATRQREHGCLDPVALSRSWQGCKAVAAHCTVRPDSAAPVACLPCRCHCKARGGTLIGLAARSAGAPEPGRDEEAGDREREAHRHAAGAVH